MVFDVCYQTPDNPRHLAETELNNADAMNVARGLSLRIDALVSVYASAECRLCYQFRRGEMIVGAMPS